MNSKKIKIFFDGNCIVCDLEMSHYYRINPDLFEMVDISIANFNSAEYGLDFKEVNDNMHVQTQTGEMKIGVDAFAYIWSKIPRYSLASHFIKLPGIYSLAKMAYWVFAKNRHLLPKKKR